MTTLHTAMRVAVEAERQRIASLLRERAEMLPATGPLLPGTERGLAEALAAWIESGAKEAAE